MSRMKTLFTYLILFLLFYVFTNVMIYLNIRATLVDIENNGIEFQNPHITIEEAKASKVNVIIKGKLKSEENQDIQFKYIRFDLLSENDNVLNSRYIETKDLVKGQETDFSIRSNTENVKKYRIVLTDNKEASDFNIKIQESSKWIWGAFLVFLLI